MSGLSSPHRPDAIAIVVTARQPPLRRSLATVAHVSFWSSVILFLAESRAGEAPSLTELAAIAGPALVLAALFEFLATRALSSVVFAGDRVLIRRGSMVTGSFRRSDIVEAAMDDTIFGPAITIDIRTGSRFRIPVRTFAEEDRAKLMHMLAPSCSTTQST